MLSASGELRSLTPDQGLCLWTPLGAPPQTALTPVMGSRVRHEPTHFMTKFAAMICIHTNIHVHEENAASHRNAQRNPAHPMSAQRVCVCVCV